MASTDLARRLVSFVAIYLGGLATMAVAVVALRWLARWAAG